MNAAAGIRKLREACTWTPVRRGQNPIYDALLEAESIALGDLCPDCWRWTGTHVNGKCTLNIDPPVFYLSGRQDQFAPGDPRAAAKRWETPDA